MKLTKLQRYTAYCIMMAESERKVEDGNFSDGLCYLLYTLSENKNEHGYMIKDCLPELNLKLRKRHDDYDSAEIGCIFKETISGWQQRIALLKQCIIETHPNR